MNLSEILQIPVLGNPLGRWLIVLAIGIGAFVALRVFLTALRSALARVAGRTKTHWDDLLSKTVAKTRFSLVFLVALFLAARILVLPAGTNPILASAAIFLLLVQGGIWASAFLHAWFDEYRTKRLAADPASVTGFTAIAFLGSLLIWSIVLLLALDNFGVDITALVAGLGVGGIAVALALQNILTDLFASLSIVLDKPFVLGDFIVVGEQLGAVEAIGLKTTRLRSLSGEQLVFANSDLLTSRIHNYGRMRERRIVFAIGVVYDTPADTLERIPAIIREAIEQQDKTRFDRAHFKSFGDSSLDFETVYYVLDRDYNLYMDIQQTINLAIVRRFEEEGIAFAFPTRTLFVNRLGEPA